MDMTPPQFRELPEPPKKHEYENAQFEPEAPQMLSGVMNRWVAPEGYTGEEEPVLFMMHKPPVEEEQEEEEPFSLPKEEKKQRIKPLYVWLIGLLFVLMFFGNIYSFFFRK